MHRALRQQLLAIFLIILVTIIWGFSFVVSKVALNNIPTFQFIFFRFIVAAAAMAVICGKKQLKTLSKKDIKPAIHTGLALGFAFAFQSIGTKLTTASNTAFITASYVIIIPLITGLLTKKIQRMQLLIAILAFVGLTAFSLDRNLQFQPGDSFVFLGALGFAVHFLILGRYTKEYDTRVITFLQLSVASIVSLLISLATEPLPQKLDMTSIFCILYSGLLATGLAFFIQSYAQRILSATQTAVLMTGESLFGGLFGWLCFQETFIARQLLGGALLIACMVAIVLLPAHTQNKKSKEPLLTSPGQEGKTIETET